jgi:flagellar assembly protein FliH
MSSFRNGNLIRQYRFLEPAVMPAEEDAPAEPRGAARNDGSGPSLWEGSDQMVGEARAEAERITRKAREEAAAIAALAREEARKEGFEAGRQEGLALAERETREEIASLQEILQGTVAQRSQILASAEESLVELALAIARKIIGDAASRDIGVIAGMARQAIEVLGRPGSVRVHLNPGDAERMAAYWQVEAGGPAWEIVPDERVSPGGCIVTSGSSEVDARPDTQLALIQASLTQAKEEE